VKTPRGQNLMLLALTMLLVTLMVLITLGLGFRIRENHELNNLADVSAYSSAVVNARSYNNIAILNRLQVAYWVSMAANESLISWTTYTKALWSATMGVLYGSALNENRPASRDCKRMTNDIGKIEALIKSDFLNYNTGWRAADNAAGQETREIQGVIAGLREETRGSPPLPMPDGVRDRLFTERMNQNLARQIVARSGVTGITVVPTGNGGAAQVSDREVGNYSLDNITDCSSSETGLCQNGLWSWNILNAAMGSRGNSFVTGRGVLPPVIKAEWTKIQLPNPPGIGAPYYSSTYVFAGGMPGGSAYWSDSMSHAGQISTRFAWGDDHGTLSGSVTYGNCNGSQPGIAVTSHVKTTDLLDTSDEHQWSPQDPSLETTDPQPDVYHTTGDCTPLCPSVWVKGVNFQPDVLSSDADAPKDVYGMPKVNVLLVRDTTARSDPWQLNFKFGFTSTGSTFDNRGRALHGSSVGSGLNMGSQGALATGIAYYHRKDTWQEYPNLLNPFWRATLVPIDVDKGGKGRAFDNDPDTVLGARPTEAWQGAAYDALVGAGFKGLH
jgi:hypothetical protein